MSRSFRPLIRNCPICGLAMQGAKADEGRAGGGFFECLTCHTTIVERPATVPPAEAAHEPPKDPAGRLRR